MVSIFAKFRAGHKAAQQQPGLKDKPVPTGSTTPYRHVPTHSFSDALAGTPGSYRAADRRRIRESHRQRSLRRASLASESVGSAAYQAPSGSSSTTMAERGLISQKSRLMVDRGEPSQKKSPLSSMEVSPHISGENSDASVYSSRSSSHRSLDESLSKITEEACTPGTSAPGTAMTAEDTIATSSSSATPIDFPQPPSESFWAAPRQLASQPDRMADLPLPVPDVQKPARRWHGGRRRPAVEVA